MAEAESDHDAPGPVDGPRDPLERPGTDPASRPPHRRLPGLSILLVLVLVLVGMGGLWWFLGPEIVAGAAHRWLPIALGRWGHVDAISAPGSRDAPPPPGSAVLTVPPHLLRTLVRAETSWWIPPGLIPAPLDVQGQFQDADLPGQVRIPVTVRIRHGISRATLDGALASAPACRLLEALIRRRDPDLAMTISISHATLGGGPSSTLPRQLNLSAQGQAVIRTSEGTETVAIKELAATLTVAFGPAHAGWRTLRVTAAITRLALVADGQDSGDAGPLADMVRPMVEHELEDLQDKDPLEVPDWVPEDTRVDISLGQ